MMTANLTPAEGGARRPERCTTCGCELAYPTAIHVLDCRGGRVMSKDVMLFDFQDQPSLSSIEDHRNKKENYA